MKVMQMHYILDRIKRMMLEKGEQRSSEIDRRRIPMLEEMSLLQDLVMMSPQDV